MGIEEVSMLRKTALYSLILLLLTGFFSKFYINETYANSGSLYKPLANEVVLSDYTSSQWSLANDGTLRYRIRTGGTVHRYEVSVDAVKGVDIDFNAARALYSGGKKEVTVAIIDTGIDISNPEIKDAIWTNKKEIPYNGVDDDNNGYIDDINGWNFYDDNNVVYTGESDEHGTHIAGVISAKVDKSGISGIAGGSNVKIMPIKAIGGTEETGYTDIIIKAIEYAENNGATICNLSFGTEKEDKRLKETIKNSKMLFVVAAGNGDMETGIGYNIETRPMYPAAYDLPNLIKVANLQADGTLHLSSNFSDKLVDLAAPGSKILSIVDSNRFARDYADGILKTPYVYMSGTSISVPMVVGTAALIASDFPDITVKEIKEAILNGTKKLPLLEGKVCTGGMLSAEGALKYCIDNFSSYKSENSNTGKIENKQPDTDEENLSKKSAPEKPESKEVKKFNRKAAFNKANVKVVFSIDKTGKVLLKLKGRATIGYVAGNKKLSYFKKSKKWEKIKFNSKNKKFLKLKMGKTYTFYVISANGKSFIKRLTLKR